MQYEVLHCPTNEAAALKLEIRYKYPNALNVLTTSIHPNWVRTPLLAPFEDALKVAGSAVLEPQYVVDAIAKQIFKCAGGQVFLPPDVKTASALRGLPNWLQEMLRGGIAKTVLQATS